MAAPIALVATGLTVAVGVGRAEVKPDVNPPRVAMADLPSVAPGLTRAPIASRGGRRDAGDAGVGGLYAGRSVSAASSPVDRAMRAHVVRRAVSAATEVRWTTTDLNIWTRPDDRAVRLGVLDEATKVRITGRAMQGRQEVVLDGTSRWVTAGYLSDSTPEPEPSLGGQCTNGTTVPAGVSANIRAVHQAVCANFPSITTYGTLRSDGEHSQGIAVDIMVSGSVGQQVADFVRQYSSAMGVSYVIHARRIWSVQRSAEGWRSMADRGSVTANHYDHVHVTTY